MPESGEKLFWELVEPMYADPSVRRSTMMGLPCVRRDGSFFASLEHRSGALLVKLPRHRVEQLLADGHGEPFAPAGRVFREWVALPDPDRDRWAALLSEALDHAAGDVPERFPGFGAAGLAFLAGLERDNSKAFFDAGREVYRRELAEPAEAYVTELGARLRERVPGLRAEPRIGGSLFRIANDLRFAPDRPPYRPHLDFAFWQGPHGPRTDPALLVRITPAEVHLGCGVMPRTGAALESYRDRLRDEHAMAALDRHVTALTSGGAELSEPTRRRLPAGFGPDGPAARFAVRDGLHVMRRHPHPGEITSPALTGWCARRLDPFLPLLGWLTWPVAED
ncbi:DUF2461 family protein [Actinoplanes sp. NPDC051861]|uniref:DUF2461 family protein n=1 Tax=Actinoplanes sp. NPDC051861 TaxID=3155170 RepID=UPI003419E366